MPVYILELTQKLGAPRTHDFFTGQEIPADQRANPARCSAQTYIGYAEHSIDERFEQHRSGKGAAFTRAAVERGIEFVIVARWEEADYHLEKFLKSLKDTPALMRKLRAGKLPKGVPQPDFIQ